MNVSTYASYKEHCEVYAETPDLSDVKSCLIQLFKKHKIVLEDIIFIKHSESSASGTFKLNDYIQLKSRTLNWRSHKKAMDLPPTISFSLSLVYLTTTLKITKIKDYLVFFLFIGNISWYITSWEIINKSLGLKTS